MKILSLVGLLMAAIGCGHELDTIQSSSIRSAVDKCAEVKSSQSPQAVAVEKLLCAPQNMEDNDDGDND